MSNPSRLADARAGALCGPPAEDAPSRARILVADDEPLVLQGLRRLLEQDGYEVSAALGGREAERQASETRFDVVVSDVHMPDLDGIELLRRLRRIDRDIAVVLMTGRPQASVARRAVALGASQYLQKPIDREKLRRTIEEAVSGRRSIQIARAPRAT
jgi:CheY-like chemotaxis protein